MTTDQGEPIRKCYQPCGAVTGWLCLDADCFSLESGNQREVGKPKGEEISLDLVGRLQERSLSVSPGSGARVLFFLRPPSLVSQAHRENASRMATPENWRIFIQRGTRKVTAGSRLGRAVFKHDLVSRLDCKTGGDRFGVDVSYGSAAINLHDFQSANQLIAALHKQAGFVSDPLILS